MNEPITFRPHRGGFKESMAEAKEFNTLDDLDIYLSRTYLFKHGGVLSSKCYFHDKDTRNGWERTYIVLKEGVGPVGFVNCSVPDIVWRTTVEADGNGYTDPDGVYHGAVPYGEALNPTDEEEEEEDDIYDAVRKYRDDNPDKLPNTESPPTRKKLLPTMIVRLKDGTEIKCSKIGPMGVGTALITYRWLNPDGENNHFRVSNGKFEPNDLESIIPYSEES